MYNVCVLVRANSKEDAIDEAEWFIDDLEEYGYIKPGDNVMVDTTISPVVGCEAPNEFVDRLMAEHDRRNDVLQATITRFHTRMQQIGRTDLNDLIPAERGDVNIRNSQLLRRKPRSTDRGHDNLQNFNRRCGMPASGHGNGDRLRQPRYELVWIQVH